MIYPQICGLLCNVLLEEVLVEVQRIEVVLHLVKLVGHHFSFLDGLVYDVLLFLDILFQFENCLL